MVRFFVGLVWLIGLVGSADAQVQSGKASFYANYFEGKFTACGEVFTQNELTAAHQSLPFHTMVKVTNLQNGNEIVVRINDRGPFVKGRIIDLSHSAAIQLDFVRQGVADVKIEIIPAADLSSVKRLNIFERRVPAIGPVVLESQTKPSPGKRQKRKIFRF